MKRLSAVVPALILAATLAAILFGCSIRSSYEPAVLPSETKALDSESPATFVPVPIATVVPTEDVQNSPHILSQLKDVSILASQNLELSIKAENTVAYSWIFTSPSSYTKGSDVTVFAEELTKVLPAKGFTVSGANSSTLKLTHVPYSLNGWTVQVQCFGRNGATAIGIPVSISVTLPPQPLPNPPAAETPWPAVSPTPTVEPDVEPTAEPTSEPTAEPTVEPTAEPTAEPSAEPTAEPTSEPAAEPTVEPTAQPTAEPVPEPTAEPSAAPTEPPAETESPVETAAPSVTDAPAETAAPLHTETPAETEPHGTPTEPIT